MVASKAFLAVGLVSAAYSGDRELKRAIVWGAPPTYR
jgi:hypothetical protein